ncbi:MAG: DUF6249 domain-containing protein [bacterium]
MHGEFLIPIVMFLVTGLVLVTYFYFRSREKQLMIEKGMSYEQMLEFLKSKRNPYTWLKLGVITFFFGLGLGFGMMLEDFYDREYWVPFLLFTSTGLGFVVAFYVTKKYEIKD